MKRKKRKNSPIEDRQEDGKGGAKKERERSKTKKKEGEEMKKERKERKLVSLWIGSFWFVR